MQENLVTTAPLAEDLKLYKFTVYRLTTQKKIPASRLAINSVQQSGDRCLAAQH
jgi:hypothetical protein